MKILKRIIIFILVIAALFGISRLFINNNFATNGDDSNTTVSLDEIGNGKINEGVIVLSQKDSEKIIDETSDIEFSGNNIVIKFKKKTPKSLKDLKKDEIILIRPSQENNKDKNEILSQGLAGIVQSVGSDSITLTSANIEDVFSELYIDTSLIKNEISESSIYLSDGVSLEKEDVYLASNDEKIKINVVDDDGVTKIENLNINVDEKEVGNTTISGDIEITDLIIDYKLDYKKERKPIVDDFKFKIFGDISYNIEFECKKEVQELLKDKPKNIFEKFNNEKNLGYILLKFGTVPVEIGVGDVISPSLGIGLFINYNREGELSIETNLIFNYSDSLESGVELVKENNKSKIEIVEKEKKPSATVEVNGFEINGESTIEMELEAAPVVLGINLASLSLNGGIEAEGDLALTTALTLSDKELDLDTGLDGNLKIDFFIKFNATADILKFISIDLQYDKDLLRYNMLSFPKEPEFDGRTVDLSGLEELSVLEDDINGDEIKDRIVMYGTKKNVGAGEAKYIVIYNGKNNEVLTTVDCYFMDWKLIELVDINGDGKKEIHFGIYYSNHNYGSNLLEYKDKTYKLVEFEEPGPKINIEVLDGFKVRLIESTLGINQTVNLTEEQRKSYVIFNVYSQDGKLKNKDSLNQWSNLGEAIVLDIDNDGELEFVKQQYISGTSEADSICAVLTVYKYIDGKFVLHDTFIQPGVHVYTKDYVEAEDFITSEEIFERPEDGFTYMIVDKVKDGYIDATEIEVITDNESNSYKLENIYGEARRYKLSDNCKYGSNTRNIKDPSAGISTDFKGFKDEIDTKLSVQVGLWKKRVCVAKIENGQITKISTVELP